MSRRSSGWITARSQIAFVIGLMIAAGLIFWLEHVRFTTLRDPLGIAWLEASDPPADLGLADADVARAWADHLVARLASLDPETEQVAALLAARACPAVSDRCAPLEAAADQALESMSGDVELPDDPVAQALMIVAVEAALQHGVADAAWLDAYRLASAMPRPLSAEPGLRQFTSRAAALVGREFPVQRDFSDLRDWSAP